MKTFFQDFLSFSIPLSCTNSLRCPYKNRSQMTNPSIFQNALMTPHRCGHFMQNTKKRMYTTCFGRRTQDVLVPLHLHLPLRILLLLLPLCSVEKKLSNRFWKVKEKVEKSVLFGFYFQELKHVKNCIEN